MKGSRKMTHTQLYYRLIATVLLIGGLMLAAAQASAQINLNGPTLEQIQERQPGGDLRASGFGDVDDGDTTPTTDPTTDPGNWGIPLGDGWLILVLLAGAYSIIQLKNKKTSKI
jgi:hypothetical protein